MTVPGPAPAAGVVVTSLGAPRTPQSHPDLVSIPIDLEPPCLLKERVEEDRTARGQPLGAACRRVTFVPATFATRDLAVPAFEATTRRTCAVPVPLDGDAVTPAGTMTDHPGQLTELTVIGTVPPVAGTSTRAGVTLREHVGGAGAL